MHGTELHVHQTPAQSSAATAEYTCPMHPEVRQIGPGTCPKCGMTLEPVIPELEEEENSELKNFTQRFWWTLPLTVIVTVLAMGGHALVLFHGPTQTARQRAPGRGPATDRTPCGEGGRRHQ